MKKVHVNAEQFRRELTELLSQAGYGGATIVVERHGTPLAALIPYQEYQKQVASQENRAALREPAVVYAAPLPQSEVGVLMIEEAAAYLRTSVETLKQEAERGEIPARKLGDSWRFSRQALDQWLQPPNSRRTLLAQAGMFAEDQTLDELITAIYQQRGRPEVAPETLGEPVA